MTIAKYRFPAGPAPYRLGDRESKVIEAARASALNVQKVTLNWADLEDGVALSLGEVIPNGAVVQKVYGFVSEAFSGDGDSSSTISLGFNTAADAQSAAAVSGAPWSSTGAKEFLDGSAAEMVVLTADRRLTATLNVEATDTALDAGEIVIYVEYVNPPA